MQISIAAQKQLNRFLRRRFPRLLAVYIYGSRAQGTARPDSDLDLAILIEGYLPPAELWETGHLLAEITNCDVDPVDFRASPTVLQSQILRSGTRIWLKDYHVEI